MAIEFDTDGCNTEKLCGFDASGDGDHQFSSELGKVLDQSCNLVEENSDSGLSDIFNFWTPKTQNLCDFQKFNTNFV
jgi:hypothetical protein